MSTEKVVRYTAEQLDKYAVNNAIERMPFNPHEKSSDETRRRVLSLAYKDGWRACEKHMESDIAGLVEALRSMVATVERNANLSPNEHKCLDHAREQLARFQQ